MWKDIAGFEGMYQVSSTGLVRSLDRDIVCKNGLVKRFCGQILKKRYEPTGYVQYCLRDTANGVTKYVKAHRVVAIAFIKNKDGKNFVNHINGKKDDNNVENLEWCTRSENMKHAYDTGLAKAHRILRKLTEETILKIYNEAHSGILTHIQIAEKYNIGKTTVGYIKLGKRNSNITKHFEKCG